MRALQLVGQFRRAGFVNLSDTSIGDETDAVGTLFEHFVSDQTVLVNLSTSSLRANFSL